MQPPQITVGMVGLGLAASAHIEGYERHPQASVVAVCDSDEERARCWAARHNIPKVYGDYETMLADPEISLVDIATPTYLHAPMTQRAAAAGKHVHCEKPFCCSVAEGLAACDAVRRNGTKLVVGETYVFLTSHVKARELIAAGEIGRPMQVRLRHGGWCERPQPSIDTGPADRSWRVDPQGSGGGHYPWLFDHAVHFFASAEYFMLDVPISEIYAVRGGSGGDSESIGAAHDPYTSAEVDIPIITWSHVDQNRQGVWMRAERLNHKYDYVNGFSTTIIGETGVIEVLGEGGGQLFENGEPQHLVLHRQGKPTLCFRFDEGGDAVWDSDICYYTQGHANQIHHLIGSILTDTEPRYTGEHGVHAVRCTLAAIRSANEGRPVRIDEIGEDATA
jgi:predicted dehydrogenase